MRVYNQRGNKSFSTDKYYNGVLNHQYVQFYNRDYSACYEVEMYSVRAAIELADRFVRAYKTGAKEFYVPEMKKRTTLWF